MLYYPGRIREGFRGAVGEMQTPTGIIRLHPHGRIPTGHDAPATATAASRIACRRALAPHDERARRSHPRTKKLLLVGACVLVGCSLMASSALATVSPRIDEVFTSHLTTEAVVLNAEIEPGGVTTSYKFEYGTTTTYGASVPAGEGSAGSGTGDVLVSQPVSGLLAGTLYHFRVLARNTEGASKVGADHTFVYQVGAPSGAGCPNTGVRTRYSLQLPDCRAYEQVSPPQAEPYFESNGNPGNLVGRNIRAAGQTFGSQASDSGERMLYFSTYGLPGAASDGAFFLASRGLNGWLIEDPVPPQSVTNSGDGCFNAYFPLRTPEFSDWVLADGYGQGEPPEYKLQSHCATDEPALVEAEPPGLQNLFLHESGAGFEAGHYQLINTPRSAPEGASADDAWAQGASEDLSRVVFTEAARLTPDAPAITAPVSGSADHGPSEDLYMWSGGTVRLVTVLPGGAALAGSLANGDVPHDEGPPAGVGAATFTHAVSSDGAHVAFEAGGNLYVRENAQQPPEGECSTPAQACTVALDAGEGGSGAGGGHFEWASSDGSRVFFTDEQDLTAGAKAAAGKPDLYEYDFKAPVGSRLTDLTAGTGEAGGVLGVSGASEEGSVVYFVAEANLTGGQANTVGASAQPGKPNLYVRQGGKTTFIATLGAGDSDDWESPPQYTTARVSPSGQFIAFDSLSELTGFDNHGPCAGNVEPLGPGQCQEIFLYDAERSVLSCASCAPSGELPSGPVRIGPPIRTDGTINENAVGYLQRFLSDSGQVFFNTIGRLLPGDTNGLSNVYEYENGELRLLSPGSSGADAYFSEASANGENVFLLSSELLGSSKGEIGLFDARVDGGFPEAPAPVTPCGEGDCAPPAGAPSFSTPASMTFVGPPNPPLPLSSIGGAKPQTAAQIRAKALAKALESCRAKRSRHKRAACEAQARRRYRPAAKARKAAGRKRQVGR